jgi:hypothetical protein
MRLVRLSGCCVGGDCPTVYAADQGTDLFVQGYDVTDADALVGQLPPGEHLVRVPIHVLTEAARRLKGSDGDGC